MSIAATAHAPGLVTQEILAGTALSLSQAAKYIPSSRQGRPTHAATLFRWATSGVHLPDGRRVKLEAIKLSGRWLTSREALARFIDAQQSADQDAEAVPAPRPPSQRRRSSEAADAELKRRGC